MDTHLCVRVSPYVGHIHIRNKRDYDEEGKGINGGGQREKEENTMPHVFPHMQNLDLVTHT